MTPPLTLTTDEINVAIAQEKGWKWARSGKSVEFASPSYYEHLLENGWRETDPPGDEIQRQVFVPNYTADISAAWPLWQEMSDGYPSAEALQASMGIEETTDWVSSVLIDVQAKLSPLTISLAWLSKQWGRRVELKEESSDGQ